MCETGIISLHIFELERQIIDMSECTHDCSTCGEACASREPESFLKPLHEGASVKKVIADVSGKGGVGKSLVTSLGPRPVAYVT